MELKEKLVILTALVLATTQDGKEPNEEEVKVIHDGIGKVYGINMDDPQIGDLFAATMATIDLTTRTMELKEQYLAAFKAEAASE
ncbi:hypothetical protein NS115_03800 [Paenibacillus jamilae]|uniref:Uncharacterized protein n=1 Tax=Paenibacillus jamilae TaxID=114136 RepID=A0ACC4ZZL4_9BACL|nr:MULTISPECIES: hypothetical protein [Bacillales]KTS84463.1 hypothetical protein NS115_03800 [Paenibacillus jamilae]KTT55195.1 hypothetical protein SB7C_12295 [Staphylococcus epidermidis]